MRAKRTLFESLESRRLLSVFGTDAIPKTSYPYSVKVADFNNDGIDDIGLSLQNRFEIYTSGPRGHFLSQTITYGGYQICGDFDGDSDVDVLVTDGAVFPGIKFYQNIDGMLIEDPSRFTVFDNSLFHANAIDLDGDDDLDFTVQGDYRTFANDGTGHFTLLPTPGNYEGGLDLQVVDLDGDGDDDEIGFAFGPSNNYPSLFRNDQTGPLDAMSLNVPPGESGGKHFTLGDIDGDDDIDFLYPRTEAPFYFWRVARNDGTGHFVHSAIGPFEPWAIRGGQIPQSVFLDIDDDDDLDLLVSGRSSLQRGLIASLNNGNGTFSGTEVFQINGAANSRFTTAGDFDGDGKANDLTLHFSQNQVSEPPGRYVAILIDPSIPAYTGPASSNWSLGEITRADFDHDGITDLVVGSEIGSVLLMNSDGSYQSSLLDGAPNRPTPADLDDDGWIDLIDSRDGVIKWWRNDHGTFSPAAVLKTIGDNIPFDRLRFDDFDGNGLVDVIQMTQQTQADAIVAKVWLQSSAMAFDNAVSVGLVGPIDDPADFSDIDGDSDLDMIGRQRYYRMEMQPTPHFVSITNHSNVLTAALTSLSGDWDGDGDLDIASINETNGRIEFLKNSGSGTFGSYSTVSAANIRATNRRAVDIDNDGDLDLVAEFHDPATNARDYVLGVFYNEANGNFSAPRFDALPMNTLNWELTDFDGDEQPDLFVVGDVTNNGVTDVSVYVKSNRIDVTAPTVTASFERSIPATRFTFSENVFNSLTESDFQLRRLENSSTIPSSSLDLEFESATNSVLVHYTGSANGQLPDGHYEFSILANNTSDITGNTLASDFTFNFDVYAGDIDGDGIISFSELLIVAQNYGSQNATFEQGDLDYDGDVDFEDLLLVAQRYGTSLPQLRVVSELVRPTRSSIKQR